MARVTTALVVIAFSVVFPSMVLATEYVVGDDLGWDGTANYQAWADDHAFHVGDVLSEHNVLLAADPLGIDTCVSSPSLGVYDSGNDALTLSVAGTYYFLCGYHCDTLQQTFFIVVG
ncbi:blue copper protein [Rosa chinensis]|uniref:blue copper protein n=1 Tax=Rosa chinensis TaxID=74649 RepID=UPI001AD8E914|nr:blue copper protein [Rosa chinensis]